MQKEVQLQDKKFSLSISHDQILEAITNVANKMNKELKGQDVLFLGILNGAFLFAADLFKKIDLDCQITFVKVASYQGTVSTGNVKRLIGINEDISNRTVVIIEDIIDTGNTLDSILKQLKGYSPKEIKVATLLFKPEVYKKNHKIHYVGMEIPDDFIVGYGLDYNGYGRNLKDIYTVIDQ